MQSSRGSANTFTDRKQVIKDEQHYENPMVRFDLQSDDGMRRDASCGHDKVKKCYAGTLHVRFGGASSGYAATFEEVTLLSWSNGRATRWADLTDTDRPDKPWLDGYPRLIFVSDMSDSLSSTVEFDYLEAEIIDNVTSDLGSRHHWLWLTKRPDRMAKFSRLA